MKKAVSQNSPIPEFEELRARLVVAAPLIGNEVGSILGRKRPRMSGRDRAALERKLDQFMRSTVPHIKKLEELKDKPNVDLERYVALDQYVTGLLHVAGR